MPEKNEQQPEPDIEKEYQINITIYRRYGLELTMSEAARLRHILRECREEQKQITNWGNHGFEIGNEANARFFLEVFGINILDYLGLGNKKNKMSQQEYEKRMRDLMDLIKLKIRPESEKI